MSRQPLVNSFFSAFKGIKHALRERNFVIQIMIGIVAIALSLALGLTRAEKIIVLILIVFVLASEVMNSACERILNLVTSEHNAEVARIKEMLAGSVLIYSVAALVIGLWIFGDVIF